MSRGRALAASIALALVPVSVATGVIVPPSYASSSDATPPEITWDQVAAAQASVAATKALADKIKGAIFSSLDRCGHWATVESPRESSQKLADFLRRVDR